MPLQYRMTSKGLGVWLSVGDWMPLDVLQEKSGWVPCSRLVDQQGWQSGMCFFWGTKGGVTGVGGDAMLKTTTDLKHVMARGKSVLALWRCRHDANNITPLIY